MPYTDFFIIGNGFDRAHGMPTGYGDFKRWLIENYRFDVIHELTSSFRRLELKTMTLKIK